MFSKRETAESKPAITVRTRDLCGIVAVTMVGTALVHTAWVRGAAPSGNLSVASFIAGAILIIIGYGGGSVIDRLGRRYPILVKQCHHPLIFAVLVPITVAGVVYLWWHRDRVSTEVTQGAKQMLVEVNQQIDQLGAR